MFALSPKARKQARIAGLVCAAYGIAMFGTHAYVKAHKSQPVAPVVFRRPTSQIPKKRSPKQLTTKTSRASESAKEKPSPAATTSERTPIEASSQPPSSPSGNTAVNSTQVAPMSTVAVPGPVTAPAVIVSGGGTAPSSQGFIPNGGPGMVQGPRPNYRGPVASGPRPPNYPNSQGNRPPPQMPRGAPRPAGAGHPTGPPLRRK